MSKCDNCSHGMCALLVEQKGCDPRALARAVTFRAASGGGGICIANAETVLSMTTALRAEATEVDASLT